MRRLLVATLWAGLAQTAHAADLPDFGALRGPVGYQSSVVNWDGFYAGGQAGYGAADMNFSNSNSALIARLLDSTVIEQGMQVSSWPLAFGKKTVHQAVYGGFVGYNSQWDDVVIGVEANYMHGNFNGNSSATVGRISSAPLSDGDFHSVNATSAKTVSITDMGTVRARAGYVVDNFLPYVFGGLALGRANISSNVTVTDQWGPTQAAALAATPAVLTASDGSGGKMLYGFTAGLGTEIMLTSNVFARAEWEYLSFVNAGANININTVRGGVGYKF